MMLTMLMVHVQRHFLVTSSQSMVGCGRQDEKDEGMR